MPAPFQNSLARLSEKDIVAQILLQLDKSMLTQWFGNLVRRVQSTQPDGENHGWLEDVAGMVEGYAQDGEFEKLAVSNYFIRNIPWHAGLQIRNVDWDHSRRDLIEQRITDKTDLAMGHPGFLLQNLVASGATKACVDGNYFFAPDHALLDGSTQANKLTFNVTNPLAPTVQEFVDAIIAAVAALYGLKTGKGNFINLSVKDLTIASGLNMWPALVKAMNLTQINATTNAVPALQGKRFNLVDQPMPLITGQNKFWVIRQNAAPFIWQVLDEIQANVLGRNSEHALIYSHLLFKLDGFYNLGFGAYQHAVEVEFKQAGA